MTKTERDGLNIVMVIDRYVPLWGGAENQLRQLIPYLQHQRHSVSLVTRRWYASMRRRETIDTIEVYRVGIPGDHGIATVFYIIHMLLYLIMKSRGTDLFHSHGAVALGALTALAGKLTATPCVVKIATAGKIAQLQKMPLGFLLTGALRMAAAVIAITDEIRQELVSIPVTKRAIVYIPNGVDTQRFMPWTLEQKKIWRKQNNLPFNSRIVLFSGRLVLRKGVDILIEAWSRVVRLFPHAYLYIVGNGKLQKDSIEDMIKNKVIDESIHNVRFENAGTQVSHYYAAADIFVIPSRKEGCPNALLEAMAAELAIIGSEIGGVVDLVRHRENGLLVPVGQSEALADAILFFLEHPEECQKMGKKARGAVIQTHHMAVIAKRYHRIYTQSLYMQQ